MNCVVAAVAAVGVVLVSCCAFGFFDEREVDGVAAECGVDLGKFWFGYGVDHVNECGS